MPLTTEQAQAERKKGYAWVCSMCVKLHEARDQGHGEGCMAFITAKVCGSPFRGQTFPLYEGPLTPPEMARSCFVCGNGAKRAVRPRGSNGLYVGICGGCEGMLQTHLKAAEGVVHG